MKLTATDFQRDVTGLHIRKNTRVTPSTRYAAGIVQRSNSPNYAATTQQIIPHEGLGVCFAFMSTGGEVKLYCDPVGKNAVNEVNAEYLIDAQEFTAKCDGMLRLYARPLTPAGVPDMMVTINNDCMPAQSTLEYTLSQVFDRGQLQLLFLGVTSFRAPFGTIWDIIEAPIPYTIVSDGRPYTLSPSVSAIVCSPLNFNRLTPLTWTVRI